MTNGRLTGRTLRDAVSSLLMHVADPQPLSPQLIAVHIPTRGWAVAVIVDGYYAAEESALHVAPLWSSALDEVKDALAVTDPDMQNTDTRSRP